MRGTRFEVSTKGLDPDLQIVGGGPASRPTSASGFGLRIPAAPGDDPEQRFLFNLCGARFPAGVRGRLIGFRQYLSIGAYVVTGSEADTIKYPLVLPVQSPDWRFTNGNVAWGIRRVASPTDAQSSQPDESDSVAFEYSVEPALLYETPLPAYQAPGEGRFFGEAIPRLGDLGTFYDLRETWRNSNTNRIQAEFEGPCDILFQASVLQTMTTTIQETPRPSLVLPGTLPAGANSVSLLPAEDIFVKNFPQAVYWTIAGALVFEVEEFYKLKRKKIPKRMRFRNLCDAKE